MPSPRRKEEAITLSCSYLTLVKLVHNLTFNNETDVSSSAPVGVRCVLFIFDDSEVFLSNQYLPESSMIRILLQFRFTKVKNRHDPSGKKAQLSGIKASYLRPSILLRPTQIRMKQFCWILYPSSAEE